MVRSEADSNGFRNFSKIQTNMGFHAKTIVRDIARVMGYEPSVGNALAKMIPNKSDNEDEKEVTLEIAYRMNPDIEEFLKSDEKIRHLWDIGMKLMGCIRSTSTHACGHIPTPTHCSTLYPCHKDKKSGYLVCEYNMTEAEHLGNLKKDLLMLKNLTIISVAHEAIKRHYNIDVPLWNDEILYDKEALALFSKGDLNGVFQFESEGMKKFMMELKPDTFEDIIAGVSLYRPGPMDYIPDYIKGKHETGAIAYDFPELEEILAPTYGVITYQEQVMQIVQKLAGFSKGEADVVRKGIGKKKMEIIEAEGKKFIDGDDRFPGAVKNGFDKEKSAALWDKMKEFGKYAFNKSHAACYAAISMQTAYLKAHYPTEFEAGLLTAYTGTLNKFIPYIYECKSKGIQIKNPDINKSEKVFVANPDGSLTYGLLSIKGVGSAMLDGMLEERKNGEYKSINDIVKRTDLNKKAIEQLIKAGAMDGFGHTRRAMIESLAGIIASEKKEAKSNLEGQFNLFDMLGIDVSDGVINMPEYDKKKLLENEKDALGFYLSGHPVETYMNNIKEEIQLISNCKISEDDDAENAVTEGTEVTVLVYVTEVRNVTTKKGDSMAILTVEDMTGNIKAVCFPKTYKIYRGEIEKDAILLINGVIGYELDGTTTQIIINDIDAPEEPDGSEEGKKPADYIEFV